MLGALERGKMGGKGWEIGLKINSVVMTQQDRKKGIEKDREEGWDVIGWEGKDGRERQRATLAR